MNGFLIAMSGPAMAVLRYGLTALGTYLATKGWVDSGTWTAVAGWVLATVPGLIGTLTSTASAKIASTAALPNVASVVKTNGTEVKG